VILTACDWRSRRKEDKVCIMTLPTLLPDAICYCLLASKRTRKLADFISDGIFYYFYLMVVYKALYIDL
jgi:hypothetical protein